MPEINDLAKPYGSWDFEKEPLPEQDQEDILLEEIERLKKERDRWRNFYYVALDAVVKASAISMGFGACAGVIATAYFLLR